jgi:hypothetical protein
MDDAAISAVPLPSSLFNKLRDVGAESKIRIPDVAFVDKQSQ